MVIRTGGQSANAVRLAGPPLGSVWQRWSLSLAIALATFLLTSAPAYATVTTTALSLSASSVSAGTASILTATVTPATGGSVDFCLASATFCTGINRLQTVQVSTTGTAMFRKVFGAGTYSIKAVFRGTSTLGTSSSSAVSLVVNGAGTYATATSIGAAGAPGAYTLTGTVAASGRALPTGTVSFLNTTAGSASVGSGVLDPATVGFSFTHFPSLSAPAFGLTTGDFNEDGKVDVVTANGAVYVSLGHGDGTFAAPVSYTAAPSSRYVAAYDLNGDGHLDLVVIGTNGINNFLSYVAVLLGNGDGTFQAAQTFYAGHEGLDIKVGDLNGDGYPDIITVNKGDNQIGVFLGNGNGTFQAETLINVFAPYGVEVGDFNGDGNPDLVVTTYSGMSILLGTGNGVFAAPVAYAAGSAAVKAVVGDFNADGKLDIATPNFNDNNMTVMLGNGDGTFQSPVAYSTNFTQSQSGSEPQSITAGDFNGDGIEDIAVGTLYQGGAFFLGNGDGSFRPAVNMNAVGGSFFGYNIGIAAADFDGDGLDDLAVAEEIDGVTAILIAQQTEVATATGVSVPGPGAQQVEASYPGDAPHLASVSPTTPLLPLPSATVLAAAPASSVAGAAVTLTATISPVPTGAGSAGTVSFYNGSTPLAIVNVVGSSASYVTSSLPAGNSNLNATYSGNIVLGASSSNALRIFIGPQTATSLALSTNTAPAGTAIVLTATGINLPGGSPLTPGTVSFNYQQTVNGVSIAGSFGAVQSTSAGTASLTVRPGAGTYAITAVFVGTSQASPSSSASQALTVTGNAGYLSTIALTSSGTLGDYTLAAIVSGFGLQLPTGNISFFNTTSANATIASALIDPSTVSNNLASATGSPLTNTGVQTSLAGDLNGDGIADLVSVTCGGGAGTVSVQLGVGDGTFLAAVPYTVSTCTTFAALADVNDDGHLDLVVVSPFADTVSILLGAGDGTFTLQSPALQVGSSFPNSQATEIAIADLNNDGKLDIVVVSTAESNATVFLGNGDGTFTPPQEYPTGNGSNSVVIADLNSDGNPDLIVDNDNDQTISILLGVGDGSFQAETTMNFPYGDAGGSLAVGSLRNNGVIDLMVPDIYDTALWVYLGNNDGTFAAPTRLQLSSRATDAILIDANHDGKLDIVAAYFTQIAILPGLGDGTFGPEIDYNSGQTGGGQSFITVVAADLNNDGLVDFLTADTSDNTEAILLGEQSATATANGVYVTGATAQLVDAGFAGDATHAASLSNTVSLQPSIQAASSTTLAASSPTIAYGSSVTFTATVTPVPTGPTYGTMAFYDGATLLGTTAVNAGGVATYLTTALPGGSDAITAVYSGDAALALSTSAVLTETVTGGAANTATQLASSSATSVFGQPLTLTANVTPAPTGGSPGSVSFYQGSTLLGNVVLSISGSASLTLTTLPVGLDAITASYSGDTSFATSTSSPVSITVTALTTATVVSSSSQSATPGQSIVLTASVTPVSSDTNRGTVSFYAGSTLLGSGPLSAGGVATLTVNTLPIGADSVDAVYSGSATYAVSTSSAISIIVSRFATTTVVSASTPTPGFGQPVSFTATVTPASSDELRGAVSFYAGHVLLGTGTLTASGTSILSTSSLPLGVSVLTAVYSGSTNYASSTSGNFQIDAEAGTAITLSASPTTQLSNNPILLTAQISSTTAGMQTGTVSFMDGPTLLSTVPVSASGQATYTSTTLSDGSHSLNATYSGDTDYLPSTSSGAPVAITIADLNLALGGDNNKTVAPGAAVTYNFPLSPLVTPTFIYDVTLTASGLPPGATYTFSPAVIPAGSGTLPVAFTVQTAAGTATGTLPSTNGSGGRWYALSFGLLLPLAGLRSVRKRLHLPASLMLLLAGAMGMSLAAGLAGCGAGGLFGKLSAPAPTSYTITVSATSGSLVRTSTVQLNLSK